MRLALPQRFAESHRRRRTTVHHGRSGQRDARRREPGPDALREAAAGLLQGEKGHVVGVVASASRRAAGRPRRLHPVAQELLRVEERLLVVQVPELSAHQELVQRW